MGRIHAVEMDVWLTVAEVDMYDRSAVSLHHQIARMSITQPQYISDHRHHSQ